MAQDDSHFGLFWILYETYEIINGPISSTPIEALILIPKSSSPSSHSLIIYLHGGFIIGGSRLRGFPLWILSHASKYEAVIISTDYRLLPSPGGASHVNKDLEDLFESTRNRLPRILQTQKPGNMLQQDQVLVIGSSAGGYYAMQLALGHPKEVRAAAAIYLILDIGSEFWMIVHSKGATKTISGLLHAFFMSMKDTLARIEEWRTQGIVISNEGQPRQAILSIVQQGLWYELFDLAGEMKNEWLLVESLISLHGDHETGRRDHLRIWNLHGSSDAVVPIEGWYRFFGAAKHVGGLETKFDVIEGQEHGFDGKTPGCNNKHPTINAGLEFLAGNWLS